MEKKDFNLIKEIAINGKKVFMYQNKKNMYVFLFSDTEINKNNVRIYKINNFVFFACIPENKEIFKKILLTK